MPQSDLTPSPAYLRQRADALRRALQETPKRSSYARRLKAAIDDLDKRAARLEAASGPDEEPK